MKQINTYKYGMKNIKNYINEKLHITSKQQYTYHPTTKDELQEIIIKRIKKEGPECDLNDIDVYEIKDMSHLFDGAEWEYGNTIFKDFNGDISKWDVSNVENMEFMFHYCKNFNCDISKWDVSNVKDISAMFSRCTNFNCDISKWDVSNVITIECMFEGCTNFKQNLNKWNISNIEIMTSAFYGCPTEPKWYDRWACE